jgi:hypothetical protein
MAEGVKFLAWHLGQRTKDFEPSPSIFFGSPGSRQNEPCFR